MLLFIFLFIGGTAAAQTRPVAKAPQNGPVKATAIQTTGYTELPSRYGKVKHVHTIPNNSKTDQVGEAFNGLRGPSSSRGLNRSGKPVPLTGLVKTLDMDDTLKRFEATNGQEVEFRVPSDPGISSVCATPRPYLMGGSAKSPGCPFTVPCDNPANRDATLTTVKYFQLVWHVMQSSGGGASSNIDQTRIDDLMAELNADFATHNMIFCADPANFYVDDVNYTHDSNTEEVSLKTTYNVTPTQVINIYVVGSMTAGGYARFPYDPMGGTSPTGGIVLNRGNCNVGTHTLAHEMGHTFGLEHTFAGVDERTQCSACYEQVRNANGSSNTTGVPTPNGGPYTDEGDREGDWCSDTNPHDTYAYNCSTSGNPNGACDSNPWANAPVNNHMSYSFCSSQFTNQQRRRMHCMTSTYLGAWIAYGGGVCGALPPVADFIGTPTSWVAPSDVVFTDQSTPTAIVTGWTWVFDVAASGTVTCAGCVGANATYVGQVPPTVTYPNVGLYTVSLTITSPNGPDSETKVDYIEVTAPASDCDTLDTDWFTPAPTPTIYTGAYGFFTGVPAEGSNLPIDPAGFYQQYFTPTPGTSIVGAVTAGLGFLVDPDDDMILQVVVYEDDAGNPGFPDWAAGPVAFELYSPTQIGVPTGAFYAIFDLPFTCAPTIAGPTFHVGVEMFPGDATDQLVLMTNADGEGGSPLTNTYLTSFCPSEDYNVGGHNCGYAPIDYDLLCYPQMGWYEPFPLALGFTEDVGCDTTEVDIFFGTLYDGAGCVAPSGPNVGMVNWTYTFSDGTTYSSPTEIPVITRNYTVPGPDIVTIIALNDCGRADTTSWIIPYNFMTTPDADFTKSPQNPICLGTPVTFTANTPNYPDYTWDFGDGTVISSGASNTTNHTYAAVGTYYVNLDVTALGYQPSDTFYLEDFEAGWPAGYNRFDNDPYTPAPPVNPPFTGSNATAWLAVDVDGDGDGEAVSTSWNTGATQQADDWMLTTGIGPLPANQMLTWEAESWNAAFPDGYEVRISTTGQLPANIGNYNTLLLSVPTENAFVTTRSVNLSAYAGQTINIAFRNNATNGVFLLIDNIRIGTIGQGCTNSEQKLDFVEVVDCTVVPPTADLQAAPIVGCYPLSVTFTDNSTLGDPPTSWLWNFGDGTFSTMQNPPVHSYSSPGFYYVIFQACNSGGCDIDTLTVNVTDCGALPIELIEFNAIAVESRWVDLIWSTASESNNDYFIIERSRDVVNWEFVTSTDGAGTSNEVISYYTTDDSPYLGRSYYRLKQFDFDGASTTSEIRSVLIDEGISLYPNPTNSSIVIHGSDLDGSQIKIYDVLGKEIKVAITNGSIDEVSMDLSPLATGIYYLKTRSRNIKIIKQ